MTDPIKFDFIRQLQENPFNKIVREVFADWLSEHGDEEREVILRAGNIPLTEMDESAVFHLALCRMPSGSFDKRFAQKFYDVIPQRNPGEETPCGVTPKMYLWLWILIRRYRKSVMDKAIKEEADRRYAGYVDLLDLSWLKPNKRRRTKRTSDLATLFDEI